MKREILFRGKIKYNGNHLFAGDWAIGSLVLKSNGVFIYVIEEDEFGNITREYEVEVIPETIGQFTGLTDKSGVKIFEGDIVRYYQPYSQKWEEDIVLWDMNWASFGLFEQGSAYCKESDWVKIQHIEIIGNIHDNPELLK